jgi:hypothetical protein
MDLNSINSSTAAGTLTILMSENNYGPAQLLNKISANLAVGGTTQGNVQFNLWMDDTNGYPNDLGDLLASTGVLTGVPFVGSGSGSGPAFDGDEGFNLYSLTLETIITHGRGGVLTSFDIAAQIPEPATLILLGFGLLGVAAIRRKR